MFGYLLRCLQYLYCVYAFIIFLGMMLIIFPFVLLASLVGRIEGGNLIFLLLRVWADTWFLLIGIRHRNIFLEPLQKEEVVLYVANHSCYLDAALIVKSLRFHFRPLAKQELQGVPVFGCIYRSAVVMVDRSSVQRRAQGVRAVKKILAKKISVLVFPEGTFNETGALLKDFYDGAFRLAIELGIPIRPLVLVDAARRMHPSSIFTLTPGVSRAVFLEKVPVQGYRLEDLPVLKEKVYRQMEAILETYQQKQ